MVVSLDFVLFYISKCVWWCVKIVWVADRVVPTQNISLWSDSILFTEVIWASKTSEWCKTLQTHNGTVIWLWRIWCFCLGSFRSAHWSVECDQSSLDACGLAFAQRYGGFLQTNQICSLNQLGFVHQIYIILCCGPIFFLLWY